MFSSATRTQRWNHQHVLTPVLCLGLGIHLWPLLDAPSLPIKVKGCHEPFVESSWHLDPSNGAWPISKHSLMAWWS